MLLWQCDAQLNHIDVVAFCNLPQLWIVLRRYVLHVDGLKEGVMTN